MKCPTCQTDNPSDSKFCKECATPLPPSKDLHPEATETLQSPIKEFATGSTFAGRYQIIEELGHGGMGKVYRVVDKKLNEEVALKLIKPEIALDKKSVERFSNELKLARKIGHRNVGKMYELMEDGGTHFITMEYIPGQDLKGLIRQSRQLAIGTAISIAKQVCDGLAEAHRVGIVHRDLKPSNIMIDKEGNARIMDFGIARSLAGKGITGAGMMIGTPEYMSPEQVEGKNVDPRSDIYSLGIILYEMVTGQLPFEGDTPFAVGIKQKSEIPRDPGELNAQVPEDLSRVILKCLEKARENRYKSADELKAGLATIEHEGPTGARVIPRTKTANTKGATVKEGKTDRPRREKEAVDSIAVLPFVNVSGDPNTEYLSDGIPESLINSLAQLSNLRVVPRNMAFRYKGKDVDAQKAGKELKVRSILMGRVIQRGESLDVRTELVDVQKVSQLWGAQYNRKLADIQAVQEEIATEISDKLRLQLTGAERKLLTKRYTESTEAYQLNLKGLYYGKKMTEEAFRRAIQFFNQAIEKDPGFALAHAGLANFYANLSNLGYLAPRDTFPQAIRAAQDALALDDSLADAHAVRAFTAAYYDWNWQEAEKEFKCAIALNPNIAYIHMYYGQYLDCMGRFEEGLLECSRAREIEPTSLEINAMMGVHYAFARQFEQAVKQLTATLEMEPNFAFAHWLLGGVYQAKPTLGDVVAQMKKALALEPSSPRYIAGVGIAYSQEGKRSEALKILADLQELSKRRYVPPTSLAFILLYMEDKREEGFKELERGYEDRTTYMCQMKVMPQFDPFRSDPRFQALLRRMNFPQ
ncbi:MAG: protein kinase [Candidatus Aminicenantales bacterium]